MLCDGTTADSRWEPEDSCFVAVDLCWETEDSCCAAVDSCWEHVSSCFGALGRGVGVFVTF
jgi:hypothetical protein